MGVDQCLLLPVTRSLHYNGHSILWLWAPDISTLVSMWTSLHTHLSCDLSRVYDHFIWWACLRSLNGVWSTLRYHVLSSFFPISSGSCTLHWLSTSLFTFFSFMSQCHLQRVRRVNHASKLLFWVLHCIHYLSVSLYVHAPLTDMLGQSSPRQQDFVKSTIISKFVNLSPRMVLIQSTLSQWVLAINESDGMRQ